MVADNKTKSKTEALEVCGGEYKPVKVRANTPEI
jgi:hypothetical protein